MAQPPEGHPEIDFSKWSPPGEGDGKAHRPADTPNLY
jgi:hypothetical protein